MTGAARLAARAAQRIGAGMVTLAASSKSLAIYAAALESVIVREASDAETWASLANDPRRDVVLIGPGLGIGDFQASLVLASLETSKPCVLDAEALTNFSGRSELLFVKLHQNCVLTPHEGEFVRLFGDRIDCTQTKHMRALAAAKIANTNVLLKGADTVIAAPDGRYVINDNAPAWLATAGAGDVLAGIIAGLVAQKMPVFLAAAAAVWIHGKIASNFGAGLIAEDLVDGIPEVVQELIVAKGS